MFQEQQYTDTSKDSMVNEGQTPQHTKSVPHSSKTKKGKIMVKTLIIALFVLLTVACEKEKETEAKIEETINEGDE